MPHFTLQISQEGALVVAYFGVSTGRENALKEADQPVPSWAKTRALVDTGASCTCVDPSILRDSLQLIPTGRTTINTPSTGNAPVECDVYDVSLLVPSTDTEKEAPLMIAAMPVVCADLLQSQGFHALIGRDVLTRCVLSYNGSIGWFTLAY